MITDIKNIIINCKKGDRAAQKKIYELFSPKMYSICLRYTRNKMEAEDFLQEGFIKVFTKIDTFSFKGSFEGWVRRIIINTIIEEYRKKDINKNYYNIDEIVNSDILQYEDEQTEINGELLHQLIMELPHQYRMVFSLFVIDDYSHEEISKRLNISIGTSKSNLSRARKWLQNRINKLNTNELKHYVSAS